MSLLKFLNPDQVRKCLEMTFLTDRTAACWGSPGIAKSATVFDMANDDEVAHLDTRLTQMTPEDLRGVPYPAVIGGVRGMVWDPPFVFPRDLDLNFEVEVKAEQDTLVHFYNPRSASNKIFYCKEPKIEVRPFKKSHIATIDTNIVDEDGAHLKDQFRLTLTDETGEPVAGSVRVIVKGKTRVYWVLDEFNSAEPNVTAACYELLHDRRLGSYQVPSGVKICALGNLDTDRAYTFAMNLAAGSRLIHYLVKPEFNQWFRWAILNNLHPQVLSYLRTFPLDFNDETVAPGERTFRNPRTWHAVSDHLYRGANAAPETIEASILGALGLKGQTFVDHLRSNTSPVSVDDVLSGKAVSVNFETKYKSGIVGYLMYSLCSTLHAEYTALRNKHRERYGRSDDFKKWLVRADNYVNFLEQSAGPDNTIIGIHMALSLRNLPITDQNSPAFKRFAESDTGRISINHAASNSLDFTKPMIAATKTTAKAAA